MQPQECGRDCVQQKILNYCLSVLGLLRLKRRNSRQERKRGLCEAGGLKGRRQQWVWKGSDLFISPETLHSLFHLSPCLSPGSKPLHLGLPCMLILTPTGPAPHTPRPSQSPLIPRPQLGRSWTGVRETPSQAPNSLLISMRTWRPGTNLLESTMSPFVFTGTTFVRCGKSWYGC